MDTQANTSDFVLFLGRFHPLVVHLPIGLLILAFIMEVLPRFSSKFEDLKGATGFVWLLGALSAVLAAIFGYMLSLGGGYDEGLLDTHMWQGIAVAFFAIGAYVIKTWGEKITSPGILQIAFPVVAVLMFGFLVGAGHNGGSLTHGSGYLTQYAPQPVRYLAGLPPKSKVKEVVITDIQQAVVYRDVIAPMLEKRCNNCHNASKKKGKLRMDTYAELVKGGKHGDVFVAGNSSESEIIKRVNLDEEDDDHMPPDGKTPLSDEQIAILTWWVDAGATEDQKVADLEVPAEIQPLLAKLESSGGGSVEEAETPAMANVAPASESAIQKARDMGIHVYQIAQDINFLEANFINADTLTKEMIDALAPLSKQLIWLNLGRTSLDDNLAKGLAPLTNLTKLHLENTQITDEGLKHIAGCEKLEYLNLYGTKIGDEGLKNLNKMTNLQSLYLWQTNASKEGVAILKQSIPDLEENMGYELEQASAAD